MLSPSNVRFWGKSAHVDFRAECLVLPQHWRLRRLPHAMSEAVRVVVSGERPDDAALAEALPLCQDAHQFGPLSHTYLG